MSLFKSKRRRVLVLGCGPAGMFVTHAAREADCDVIVMSKKRRSHMFGAQYLHMPIPGLTDESFEVDYQLRGTLEEYQRKVYNGKVVPFISPGRLIGKRPAWDIRRAYVIAYDRYSNYIVDTGQMTHQWLTSYVDWSAYDYILSTIPARDICGNPTHAFESQKIYAIGDAPEKGIQVPQLCPDNTVICNGESAPSWYRTSCILGYRTMEWPGKKKPPIKDISEVTKPIQTSCTCFQDTGKFYRLGRYGAWDKGQLSHDAYFGAMAILSK